MGEATNEIGPAGEFSRATVAAGDEEGEATQIRSGIEETRSDLSETIEALQAKLDPSRIAEQVKNQIRDKATEAYDTAKNAVKEATIGKAEKIMSSVGEAVTDMTGRAGTAVSETSSSVVQYIRDNPVPFALLGMGLGMLAMNKRPTQQVSYGGSGNVPPNAYGGSGSSGSSLTDRARDAVSEVADTARGAATSVADSARAAAERTTGVVTSAASSVRDAAGNAIDATRRQLHDVSGQTRQGARVASDRFKSTLQDNPMALGFAALAAGALVGLSLPTTRVEGEYMGEARDRLVDQAKSVAEDAVGKVQRVTEEAGRTFKDAAQKEGLVSG
jgi:ElaB/YqjD/DUF883 family membrane-anchored ribosome-binding protein